MEVWLLELWWRATVPWWRCLDRREYRYVQASRNAHCPRRVKEEPLSTNSWREPALPSWEKTILPSLFFTSTPGKWACFSTIWIIFFLYKTFHFLENKSWYFRHYLLFFLEHIFHFIAQIRSFSKSSRVSIKLFDEFRLFQGETFYSSIISNILQYGF